MTLRRPLTLKGRITVTVKLFTLTRPVKVESGLTGQTTLVVSPRVSTKSRSIMVTLQSGNRERIGPGFLRVVRTKNVPF